MSIEAEKPASEGSPAATPPAPVEKPGAAVPSPADAGKVAAPAPEATPKVDEPKPDPAAPEEKPAGDESVVPEKYDLKKPENSLLSDAHLEALAAHAKEQGLSQEQAQTLLERDESAAQAGVQAMQDRAAQLSKQWLDQAKADPEIGGDKFEESVTLANRALEELFPGIEIRKFMDASGFGNHPSILKGFTKIGKMLQPEKIVQATSQPPARPPMEKRLYDHPTSQKN